MKKNKRQASAILCADLHLRKDQPICRIDNYWDAQDRKLNWLRELQKIHNKCPILIAGDIFDNWKPKELSDGYGLVSWAIEHFPKNVIAIPGQHDLPNHNIDLISKSGYTALVKSGNIQNCSFIHTIEENTLNEEYIKVSSFPFGSTLNSIKKESKKGINIALIHQLVTNDTKEVFIKGATYYSEIFKKMKGYDLIVSGDNHKTFVQQYEGQLLVNPGSMMRMKANQIDHKPCVFLWFAEDNTVEQCFFPIEEDVITREHIEEKDNSIEEFTQMIKTSKKKIISFQENMKDYVNIHKINKEVEKEIYAAMEKEEKNDSSKSN